MRGLRYAVCSAVFGFVLVAVIVELGVYMENVRTRRKAEALLRAVTQFQVGESPFLATRQTLIQFGARKEGISPVSGSLPEDDYQLLVSDFRLNSLKARFPRLWRLGLRPAAVEAELRYKEGKLVFLSYSVDSLTLTSAGETVELVILGASEYSGEATNRDLGVTYRIRPSSMANQAIQFRLAGGVLTSKAAQDAHNAAFDFDLSCISSFRGCESLCQMNPSIWRAGAGAYGKEGPPLAQSLLNEHRCLTR